MRNNKVRFSLKLKLILYMSLMIVVISGAFTWFFLDRMSHNLREELEKRGLSEAVNLGFDCKYGVLTEDSETLNKLIEGRINKPDIIYIIILNNAGKVLASNYDDSAGVILDDVMIKKSLTSKTPSFHLYSNIASPSYGSTNTFYDMSAPVLSASTKQTEDSDEEFGFNNDELDDEPSADETNGDSSSGPEVLGVVRVGLSLDSMHKKMSETLYFAIIVTTSIILISIGISFVVAKVTIAPLIRLSKAATQIAEGDLSKTVVTKSTDEIGVMTNNFNLMAVKLRESIEGLEDKVRERTIELEKEGIKTDAIIQNMTDGLIALDSDLTIFLTNKTLEKMLNVSGLLGENIAHISNISVGFEKIAKKSLNDTRTHFVEIKISEHLILKTSSCLITHKDTVLGVLLIMRDITGEKEIDRMKTNFISTVSHELRTPLTSVLGFASNARAFYRKDILPVIPKDNKKLIRRAQTIDENLCIIVSEGERLTRLINDVLDIAKMEAGKVEWNTESINIIDICQQAISVVSGYPKSSDVDVIFDPPDIVENVMGDPDRLIQVITNFLSNALKFTEYGKVVLRVEPGGENVKVSVIDTGRGIEREDIDEIFDKFKQVGGDILTDKPKGTGLGLPICKEIIYHLGGTIWVESEIGVGSRFCFTIGYAQKVIAQEKPSTPVFNYRVIDEVTKKVVHRKKSTIPQILIVDDDINTRKLLRQELEMFKYKVFEAKNGLEALEMTKNKYDCLDLIILDVMMPVIDGFDVLSAIKTNEELSHIPIIVLSAYEVENKVYRLGAEGFISKPFDKDKFASTVSKLLSKSGEKKVLIIDNDENIVKAISDALVERGCVVRGASNTEDGLKMAQSESPDIIMFGLESQDIKNGLEAIKKLRLGKKTRHIYIILIVDSMDKDLQEVAELLKVDIIEPNAGKRNMKNS